MSSRRVAQRGQGQGHHAQAVEEVLAERARGHRLAQVHAGRRPRSARPPRACACRPAARSGAPPPRAAAWPAGPGSGPAIWSKNSVPPAASSILPALAWRASVKAPRSWPNSSDSRRSSGMEGQWTLMKRAVAPRARCSGASARAGPCRCRSRPATQHGGRAPRPGGRRPAAARAWRATRPPRRAERVAARPALTPSTSSARGPAPEPLQVVERRACAA